MSNINRDYIVKLFLAEDGANRGKVDITIPIVFYTSDRRTQNIFLLADVPIDDLTVELLFAIDNQEHRVIGTRLDDKTVLFDLDYKVLQIPGTYQAAILLEKGDEALTSQIFTFTVKANLFLGGDK